MFRVRRGPRKALGASAEGCPLKTNPCPRHIMGWKVLPFAFFSRDLPLFLEPFAARFCFCQLGSFQKGPRKTHHVGPFLRDGRGKPMSRIWGPTAQLTRGSRRFFSHGDRVSQLCPPPLCRATFSDPRCNFTEESAVPWTGLLDWSEMHISRLRLPGCAVNAR